LPDFSNDEAFQGWMQVAGIGNFRKLAGYLESGLPAGNFKILVNSQFVVLPFQGKKSIVLTNNSYLGAQNPTLGIAYLALGCIILSVAMLYLIFYWKRPRPLGDLSQLSWNKP
jgi:hypothetical protein